MKVTEELTLFEVKVIECEVYDKPRTNLDDRVSLGAVYRTLHFEYIWTTLCSTDTILNNLAWCFFCLSRPPSRQYPATLHDVIRTSVTQRLTRQHRKGQACHSNRTCKYTCNVLWACKALYRPSRVESVQLYCYTLLSDICVGMWPSELIPVQDITSYNFWNLVTSVNQSHFL